MHDAYFNLGVMFVASESMRPVEVPREIGEMVASAGEGPEGKQFDKLVSCLDLISEDVIENTQPIF